MKGMPCSAAMLDSTTLSGIPGFSELGLAAGKKRFKI
jgi:hypothetical protein